VTRRRLPWWGWFGLVLATLYAAYNPWGVSLVHAWAGDALPLPVRLVLTFAVATAVALFAAATWRSIGAVGILLVVIALGLGTWAAVSFGLDPRSGVLPQVLPQVLLATVLTIGLRWGSFQRWATGVVQVNDDDDR
jgi:hypothetical protein